MGQPQVQVSAFKKPDSNAGIHGTSVEVEMGDTRDTMNDTTSRNVRFKFLDLLTSPIVDIVVGRDDNKTVLRVHQNILLESPTLTELINKFEASGPRRINMPDENVEAIGCFLEFQYTGNYNLSQAEILPGGTDSSGAQLSQHARIYTLAEKLGLPALKNLAHIKIHRVKCTPLGMLAYARWVYTNTPENHSIRQHIASSLAKQIHVLRHEVAEAWEKLCEVPGFARDMLKIVLEKEEENTGRYEVESTGKGSARKRLRSGI